MIAFLNNPNPVVKANAAAYLQHLCYNSDPVKQQTRILGGIPLLVGLVSSEQPEVHRNACGALRYAYIYRVGRPVLSIDSLHHLLTGDQYPRSFFHTTPTRVSITHRLLLFSTAMTGICRTADRTMKTSALCTKRAAFRR